MLDTIKTAPAIFIESAIDFINTSGFDGPDINLVPYNNNWTEMSDTEVSSFVNFLKDLKAAMPGKLVTASMPFSDEAVLKIGQNNIQVLNSALDHIFLMEYDMHDPNSPSKISNFHAPFKYDENQPDSVEGRKDFNIVKSVSAYLNAGVEAAKMFIGYAGYGVTLSSVEPGQSGTGLYQPFVGRGEGIWQPGILPYFMIADQLKSGRFTESFNNNAQAISGYDSKNKMFLSYDNPKTVQIKSCYPEFKGLGGTATWSLYGDKNGELLDAAYIKEEKPIEPTACEMKLNALIPLYNQMGAILGITPGSDQSVVNPTQTEDPVMFSVCAQYYDMFRQAEQDQLDSAMNLDGVDNTGSLVDTTIPVIDQA